MQIKPIGRIVILLSVLTITLGASFSGIHRGRITNVDIEKRQFTLDKGKAISWNESTVVKFAHKSYNISRVRLREDVIVEVSLSKEENVALVINVIAGVAGGGGCGKSECPCVVTPPDCATSCCGKETWKKY